MTEVERLIEIRDYLTEEVNKYNSLILQSVDLPRLKDGEISFDYIVTGVCDFYNISRDELRIKNRAKEIVRKRRMAIKLLNKYTKKSTTYIALNLGFKNHATVIHHLKSINDELSDNYYGYSDTKAEYRELVKFLRL